MPTHTGRSRLLSRASSQKRFYSLCDVYFPPDHLILTLLRLSRIISIGKIFSHRWLILNAPCLAGGSADTHTVQEHTHTRDEIRLMTFFQLVKQKWPEAVSHDVLGSVPGRTVTPSLSLYIQSSFILALVR